VLGHGRRAGRNALKTNCSCAAIEKEYLAVEGKKLLLAAGNSCNHGYVPACIK